MSGQQKPFCYSLTKHAPNSTCPETTRCRCSCGTTRLVLQPARGVSTCLQSAIIMRSSISGCACYKKHTCSHLLNH
jgi:hypothetical protein